MRCILVCACLAFSGGVNAAPAKHPTPSKAKSEAAPAPQLPAFSFQNHNPDVVEPNPTKADGSPCSAGHEPGTLTCTDFMPNIAGVRLGFLMRLYYQGRLYDLAGTAPASNFGTLLQAFATKYGVPKMGTKTWQNKAGSTFENTTATWEFSNGTLHLDQMGLERDDLLFEFDDKANDPPPPPAKVDF